MEYITQAHITNHIEAGAWLAGTFTPTGSETSIPSAVMIALYADGTLPLYIQFKSREEINGLICQLKNNRDTVFGKGPDVSRN